MGIFDPGLKAVLTLTAALFVKTIWEIARQHMNGATMAAARLVAQHNFDHPEPSNSLLPRPSPNSRRTAPNTGSRSASPTGILIAATLASTRPRATGTTEFDDIKV